MRGIVRPKLRVLASASLIPSENVRSAPPSTFTHILTRRQGYFYDERAAEGTTVGYLERGAFVLLLEYEGGTYCSVASEQGVRLVTAHAGLCAL